jgi:hypothetical protein
MRVGAQSTVIAEYDFDSVAGGPDPQGWRTLHRLQSSETAFGHVDDAGGFGPSLAPLAGSQSFWFGLSSADPRTCGWISPPGYGSLWSEQLRSVPFAVSGDVTLRFLVDVGVEAGYDNLVVQYLGASGVWETLANFSCTTDDCVASPQSFVIPAAEHAGTLSVRFYFNSEFVGDARQPLPPFTQNVFGVLLDDITLSDAGGLIDSQDFESELVGDQVSADGDWLVELNTELTHGGILADGDDVLQLPTVTNTSHVWSFFDGSPHDYGCAGHPEQAVVDETHALVRSPRIDLRHDAFGNPFVGDADSILVEFDLYAELDQTTVKVYEWRVSSIDLDCPGQPSTHSGINRDAPAGWSRQRHVVIPPAGTDEIELELGVQHSAFIPSWCPSHAPLYDNVTVTIYGEVATSVEVAVAPLRLEQNHPNPFNPTTSIEFRVPLGGESVSLRIYDVAGKTVRTLANGVLDAGLHRRIWDGRDQDGSRVASGVYHYELRVGEHRASRRMLLLK